MPDTLLPGIARVKSTARSRSPSISGLYFDEFVIVNDFYLDRLSGYLF